MNASPHAVIPPDALGPRAKIAILLPASNTVGQPEYEMLAPAGVTNQVFRMAPTPPGASAGNLETYRGDQAAQVPPAVADAIKTALSCAPQAIVLAHAMDTFRSGVAGATALQSAMAKVAGDVPVILPAFAFLNALTALGIGKGARIAALTPYWPKEDAAVQAFFTDAGYHVTQVLGLKCNGGFEIAGTTPQRIIAGLRTLAQNGVDAILQPGTNMASLKIADQAQAWLGIPVICCNTALYWQALRHLGIMDRKDGVGPLFAAH